jgi:hypothetical protein
MTRRTLIIAAAVVLAVLAGSQPAHAQGRFDFKIPFNFVANGKTFTAGQYALVVNDNQDVVTLESAVPKGGSVLLPVETRTAARASQTVPEVVFDKLNGQDYVSELLVPGDDGYIVLVTKAKHTHESVKGARTQK